MRPPLLILAGPTAVGKTGIALELARMVPLEIINGDMGQLYTPLTIGTAKPDLSKQTVPHHLFNLLDEPVDCTVTQWGQLVVEQVEEIRSRGRMPVLVGGSGFYLKSLFFPPGQEHEVREPLADDELQSPTMWWKKLESIDPERARQLHPHDLYRIQRALAIWYKTGKLPSSVKPIFKPLVSPFSLVVLTREREELYHRINERALVMLQEGWVGEVEKLAGTAWEPFLRRKKIIGYDLILDYLQDMYSREELTELIQRKTRNYAKRQITFLRSLHEELMKMCPGSCVQIECGGKRDEEIAQELLKLVGD